MAISDVVGKVKDFAVAHPYLSGASAAAVVVATGGMSVVVAGAGAGIIAASGFIAAHLSTLAIGAGIGGAAVVVHKVIKKDDDKKV